MKYAFICYAIITLSSCFSKEPEKTGFEGKSLPSFKLLLQDSVTYLDTKDIKTNDPVVFFYFGPHCPYSRSQMEEIINNIQSLKNIHFYVFTTWPYKQFKQFYNDYHLNKYSNITAGLDFSNFFSQYYGVPGVPYLAIYDGNKNLKEAFVGKIETRQIKSVVQN